MSDLIIRDASTPDIEGMADWAVAMAWETESKALDPGTVRRGIRAVFAQPGRGRYFIAERNGEPVGTLMITYEWSDWRDGEWWWIQSVYVAPAHRRQGVYAALYAHVKSLVQSRGDACGLRLYVEHHNATARRTYESLGMVDAGYAMYEALLPRG